MTNQVDTDSDNFIDPDEVDLDLTPAIADDEAGPESTDDDESFGPGLSFGFARRHGVLILPDTEGNQKALIRRGASPASISEVRRSLQTDPRGPHGRWQPHWHGLRRRQQRHGGSRQGLQPRQHGLRLPQ